MDFFDMLNTPKAVAVTLIVVLAVNAFLFLEIYSPRSALSAQRSSATQVERAGVVAVPGAPGLPEEADQLRSAGESQYR
jgi:hypothetical protein